MSHPEFFARQTFCQQASLLESAEARGSAAFQAASAALPRGRPSSVLRCDRPAFGRLEGGATKADAALGLVPQYSG
ncbi:MAG TPA: hypothetical protein VKT82_09810 [Ktedonobacterales bacterium]|nr:hypothetical protein [Ktedonobacterales bacterium]